jgi:hypothetical protein
MEGTQLFPYVKVHGDTLSIDADNFAESWPESRDIEESDIIQQLTTKLIDYPDEIDDVAIGNFSYRAIFSRDILLSIFSTMACRPTRPTTIRLGITDSSFDTFKDLQELVNLHRYITEWTLTFQIEEIPILSDQILKAFHDAYHVKKLIILSRIIKTDVNQDARDNFAVSMVHLMKANPDLHFKRLYTSNPISY